MFALSVPRFAQLALADSWSVATVCADGWNHLEMQPSLAVAKGHSLYVDIGDATVMVSATAVERVVSEETTYPARRRVDYPAAPLRIYSTRQTCLSFLRLSVGHSGFRVWSFLSHRPAAHTRYLGGVCVHW